MKNDNQTTDGPWEDIHSRLNHVKDTIKNGFQLTKEKQGRILKSRAKILARKPKGEKDGITEYIDVLEFMVANETYGIDIVHINEVFPLKQFTPIPCLPQFIPGIINVRGEIFSVIDIKKFFGLPEKGFTDLNKAIIVRSDEMTIGILADSIIGVRAIPVDNIQQSLPTLTGIRKEYLKGLTEEGLIILNIEKILGDKNIIVYDEV
ncbi:MAG: chemotaxis protein CheW [Candidatus Anammoxibacter sp.]